MEFINNIWPFVPGQQEIIFQVAGFAVFVLITVNIASAIRQQLPSAKILSALFVPIPNANKVEKIIGIIFLILLAIGFLATVVDIQVNGNQVLKIK